MLNQFRPTSLVLQRSFKNFGHKREPIPLITTLWHGFLTFTFIGGCLNWKKIGTWVYGEDYLKKDPIDQELIDYAERNRANG